jgi:hypothetical protein
MSPNDDDGVKITFNLNVEQNCSVLKKKIPNLKNKFGPTI